MRKLFVFMMVSLDGYFEGPDHDINWHNVDAEFNDFAITQLDTIDTLLFGRVTYELMTSYWPTDDAKKNDPDVAEKMNTKPKLVFSKTLKKAEWENTRLVSKNGIEEVKKLKNATGGDIAIFGSSDLCVSLIEAGLIDEFRLMINPVIIGAGTPLFKGIQQKLDLKLVNERRFGNGNVLMCYSKK